MHFKSGFKFVSSVLGDSFLSPISLQAFCSLMCLITHALISHVFVHLFNLAQSCLCI